MIRKTKKKNPQFGAIVSIVSNASGVAVDKREGQDVNIHIL